MNKKNQNLPFWKWHFNIFPTIGILVAFSLLWLAKENNDSLATKEGIFYWFAVGAFSALVFALTIQKIK